ncbi:D-alanyl-D-alanine carboxypeptidase family protein [Cellulomonas taurus]|uniref:D-alanyl-D-alanine carboxypeptidase family protein n=1 Tax=Cellulomonas taurus TaxID=2729175 RepID=UPI00145E6F67|nr:D-alanyl-D-alanine carboxypeptidase family protein [Cellulomonas taurus]
MAIRPRNPGAWMRGALALAVVVVLGGSAAVSTPPQQRGMVDSADIPVRPVVTPAARQARQAAIDDATAATRAAAQARAAAAASAIRVADLDAALTELDLVLARTRMWQPALAELLPAAPARHTPYPARIPLPATTDPTATDPASTAPATTDPANGDPAAPHSDATDPANGDAATPEPATTDPATTGLAEGTTPAADSTPTATAPEQATPDDAAPAPDLPVDPEAARVQAATAEVERRTSDIRAATAAAEEAARLAAEEEARRQAEAAAAAEAEAARRAAQAASLDGYRNGEIPADALCAPDFAPGHKLRCDAAEALVDLNQAYRDRFGVDIGLTDSYRSYASQVTCVADKGNLCATPGTLNHGWGTAVDLAGPLSRFGTTEHDWLLENARQFGWDLPAWAHPTGSKPEPWHWEYTP